MADFYFFTNPELLDLAGTGNGQSASDAFGKLDTQMGIDSFQISSCHRSNSGTTPYAYAVTKGRAAVYLPSDPMATTCTIILKPSIQPGEASGVSLPAVKYFVYHGILIDSLLDGTDIAASGNGVDWIDYIWETHPDSVDNGNPAPAISIKALEFPIAPGVSPISFSFVANATSTYPDIAAGKSIGKFDPLGFSFEIILDDYRYDPILEKFFDPSLQGTANHSKVIVAPSAPTPGSSAKSLFENRSLREEILNYLDPAAFFGCLYNVGVKSSNFFGVTTVHVGNQIAENLLTRFTNKNIVYLDIRNEHGHSFNYYQDLTDSNEYYSKYDDSVGIEVKNSAGVNNFSTSLYINNWPIIRLSSPADISSHSDNLNILNVKLPIGNNESPMYFLAYGFRRPIGVGVNGDFPGSETRRRRRFKRPSDDGFGFYKEFSIVIPNVSSLSSAGAWYTRISYLRQEKDRTPGGIQFLDYQFLPKKLIQHLPVGSEEVGFTVYETHNFVDLKPEHNNADFIGFTGIAQDNIGVTLFTYPQFKRGSLDKKLEAGMSMVASGPIASTKSFLDYMDDSYVKNGLVEGELSIGSPANKKKYYHFERTRSLNFVHQLFDGPKDQFVAMVVQQANWDNLLTFIDSKITNGELDPAYDITFTIKNRNDDDGDPKTDFDDEYLPKDTNLQLKKNQRYLKFELCVRGINTGSPDDAIPITFETGIEFVASREKRSEKLNPIFVDININESLVPGAPQVLTCPGIYINDPTKSRSSVSTGNIDALDKQVNFIYSEDFEEFIKHVFNQTINLSGGVGTTDPLTGTIESKRHGSALVYKHILSKFIEVESTAITSLKVLPVTHDVNNGEHTAAEILEDYADIYAPLGVVNAATSNSMTIQLLRNAEGELAPSSEITHEGLLLNAAYLFAVWKITRDLIVFKSVREITSSKYSNGSLTSDAQIQFAQDLQQVRSNYGFVNNIISILESEQIVDPGKLIDTTPSALFDPVTAGESYFKRFVRYYIGAHNTNDGFFSQSDLFLEMSGRIFTYLERIQEDNFSPFSVTDNSGLRYRVSSKIIALKHEYVNLLTNCIYEELGGTGGNVHVQNMALGNSRSTSSFLTSEEGRSLFLYSLEPPADPNYQNSSNHGVIKISEVVKTVVDVTRIEPGAPVVLNFAIYGIDQTVNSFGDQINTFKILSYTKSGGTPQSTSFLLDNHKYVVNPENAVWTDVSGNVLGYFIAATKDLVVIDPDIVSITFELKETPEPGSAPGSAGSLSDDTGDNVTYVICGAEVSPLKMIRFAKAFDDFFQDDVFQLTPAQQASIWTPDERENIDKLIGLISGSTSFEVNLAGGFIGMPIVPFPYVSGTTYKQGDKVMYGNEIYRADNDTSSLPGGGSWTKITFASATSYQEGDMISMSGNPSVTDGIYTAKVDFTTGVDFDLNDWNVVVYSFDATKEYTPEDRVLVNDLIRLCVSKNKLNYAPKNWIITSQITSDPSYVFDPTNNWASVDKIEVIYPPSASSLTYDQFARVRYAFASIQWSSILDKFTIDIEAYASPLISRLDNVMTTHGKPLSLLNQHTIYGQDPTTDAKIDRTPNNVTPTYIASYNQVLTALRCFGILRATIDAIVDRASAPELGLSAAEVGTISDKLETAFEAVKAFTTPAEGSISFTEIDYTDFNALKLP